MVGSVNSGCSSVNLALLSNMATQTLKRVKSGPDSADAMNKGGDFLTTRRKLAKDFECTLNIIGNLARTMEKDPRNRKEAEVVNRIVDQSLNIPGKKVYLTQQLGALQAGLEVLGALGGSLTAGAIPQVAGKVLEGKSLKLYPEDHDVSELNNEWMFGYGAKALEIVAESVGCELVSQIINQSGFKNGETALWMIKDLPLKKEQ